MKLAIMQPYLFPYIGYFQLIKAVDKFVIYDDVNFIKQGWINRNAILVQDKSWMFSVPLVNQSSFSKIKEVNVNDRLYVSWQKKFLRTIEQSYRKAPFFKEVLNLVTTVFDIQENEISISELATRSLLATSAYLGINTPFVSSSSIYDNQALSGPERVIDICKKENASQYINPIGGQELYNSMEFGQSELEFIKSLPINYTQFNNEFVPWLSIIDVMMFNSPEDINVMLDQFELL
jgi:hypothetical protein